MELLSLEPLIWSAAIVMLAIGLRYSLVDRPLSMQIAAFGFRAVGIALLVVALCRPYWHDTRDDLHMVFLIDVSESVDLAAARQAVDGVRQSIDTLAPGDRWSLFAVGSELRPFESPDDLAAKLTSWESLRADDRLRNRSRLADALLESRLAFEAGKARRVVLYSDGRETDGDVAAALRQLHDEQIDVRWRQLDSLSAPEAWVVALEPSTRRAFHGEIVRMQVQLAANRPISGNLRLIHKGVAVDQQQVNLSADEPNRVAFDVTMNTPGDNRWTAELVPDEDHFPLNNRLASTVTVQGKPRLLVLHQEPREMRSLTRALREQDIELDVRGALGLPESLEGIAEFDGVILADLPATAMSARQMQMLKRYVIDLGGGLIMLGSEDSFGLGGYYKTPVEEVLPLVSRFEKEKEKPSLAMVLVIDKSGSMQGMPIALARQAAKAAVELLSIRDMIGVIGFDGAPQLICELRSAADAGAVQAAIDSLQAGGGTYMYPAMVEAKAMLETAPAKIRHMIVLSDGHTQPADHQGLTQDAVDAGITVSTVALGGADRELLASIAEIGRGRYYETDDPNNVPQIFTKETMQASKSAIKEDLYYAVQTGDHPILAGVDETELPLTLGYVMTEAKPTAQSLLALETGDPLMAVGRYGLGTGLAYTSDLTERWGGEWLAWEGCGRFWAQIIRGVLRPKDTDGMQIDGQIIDDTWLVDMYRTNSDGTPANGVQWEVFALDEYGRKHPVEERAIGLGRYRVEFPLAGRERATLRIFDRSYDKLSVLHFERPYPTEYQLARRVPAAVEQLPAIEPESIRQEITPERTRRSVSHWAYFAALVSLLAGVVLRRI